MKAVFKRELAVLFSGITGWVIAAALPFMTGIMLVISQSSSLRFCDLMAYSWPAMALTGVIYAAGCFAADRRTGAVRAWRMLPVSDTAIVLGRFFAMCVPFLVGAAVTLMYMLFAALTGGSAFTVSLVSVIMAALCGCAVIALAMWISCLSGSAILNSLVILAVIALCVFSDSVSGFAAAHGAQMIMIVGTAVAALILGYIMFRNAVGTLVFALLAEMAALLFFKGSEAASVSAVKNVCGAFRLFDPLVNIRYGLFETGDILMYVSVMFVSLLGCVLCRKACGRRAL